MLNEQPEVFQITAESDPELWEILQRPEDRRRTYTEEEIPGAEIQRIFGDLPEQVADEPTESPVGIKAIYRNTQEKLDDLQRQVTKLTLKTACSVHGLGDRNIARIREEVADLLRDIDVERCDRQGEIDALASNILNQLAEVRAVQTVDGCEIATSQADIRLLQDRMDEFEAGFEPAPAAAVEWLKSIALLVTGAALAVLACTAVSFIVDRPEQPPASVQQAR
jgi:hypothetical protein